MTDTISTLDVADVEKLQQSVRGEVLRPEDSGYDDARRVWNAMVDRRPLVIVRAAGVADVIATVHFARERELPLSIRGGGHNVAGDAVAQDGVMLDMSRMKGIRVDPEHRTVRAQAGVLWGELDHETQAFGLATTGGQISTTGIAGLTLGGGIGNLMRRCGAVVDNLLSADIVTADGRLFTVNENNHADLFWAIRGGGGNFGAVTSFEYRLHSVGPIVLGGMALYTADKAGDFLRFYRDWARNAPEDLVATGGFLVAPPAPFVPEHLHFQPMVGAVICFAGDLEAGQRAVAPLREFATPDLDLIGPMPYVAVQQIFDAAAPFGRQVYLKSAHLTGLPDAAVDTIAKYATAMTSPFSVTVLNPFGGAVSRVGEDDTAFGHRDTAFDIQIFAMWDDPSETEPHVPWARNFHQELRPYQNGVYVNEMLNEGEERVREAYTPTTYARLARIKAAYDPGNLFRVNQNIKPAQ